MSKLSNWILKRPQGFLADGGKSNKHVYVCDREKTELREGRVLLELVEQARIKDCFDPLQLSDKPLHML